METRAINYKGGDVDVRFPGVLGVLKLRLRDGVRYVFWRGKEVPFLSESDGIRIYLPKFEVKTTDDDYASRMFVHYWYYE
ncbi:MAG: hypothetical protein ACLFTR_04950 [Candidatus Woesearchaeota archaeon]